MYLSQCLKAQIILKTTCSAIQNNRFGRYFPMRMNQIPRISCYTDSNLGAYYHGDVIKWKHFPRYWLFVRGIHRSPVDSLHKGQWHGALVFPLIFASTTGWANNRNAGDLRRHRAHYDVTVMSRSLAKARGGADAVFCATMIAWPDPEVGRRNWFVWHGHAAAASNECFECFGNVLMFTN